MANAFRTIRIDKEKFIAWVAETSKKNGIKNAEEFAERIGYNRNFLSNTKMRCQLSVPAVKVLEAIYGLNLEDILPDEEKPKQEEQPEEKVPVDLSGIEDAMKSILAHVTATQAMTDDIRKGFRVQTNPRLDTETIAEGVYSGMSRFWERNKKDILGQLRGLVFAGTYESGKQLAEMRRQ
jgi:hypothetical protein